MDRPLRQRRPDNRHSRVVAWLKVLLPMLALAILSTLFLFQKRFEPPEALPVSEVEFEELARDARVGRPRLAGMTEDGATLRLTARSVAPGAAGQIRATEVEGVLETPDGQRTDLSAAAGDFATGGRSATLSGRVVVATSTGYRIETEELHADLTHTRLESPGPVRAEGPPGRIDAGAMVLRAADGAPGAYVLVFNRGVKLIYDPPDTAPR